MHLHSLSVPIYFLSFIQKKFHMLYMCMYVAYHMSIGDILLSFYRRTPTLKDIYDSFL